MRALEPGDKVWLNPVGEFQREVSREVARVIYVIDEEVFIVRQNGFTYSADPGWLTILPPWIDEPHPLGEIQRVFAELHQEAP